MELNLPGILNKKLLNYSIASAAFLLGGETVNAQVWGFDVTPDAVLSTSGDFIDINFNGHVAAKIRNVSSASFFQILIQPGTITTAEWINKTNSGFGAGPKALNGGYSVKTTAINGWTNRSFLAACSKGDINNNTGVGFLGNGDKYVGIRFKISGVYHYGWVLVNVPSNASSITVKSYAYDESANHILTDGFLPVELTSFNALLINNSVQLRWQTTTEVNNYGFEIERASLKTSPGHGNLEEGWERIGFVKGNGNSHTTNVYDFKDANPPAGKTAYRLKQVDSDGKYSYSNSVDINTGMPKEIKLFNNYPNPFNPVTSIKYQVPDKNFITLKVYDLLGKEAATLVNEVKEAGIYENTFDASELPSGTYFYTLTVGNFTETKKLLLLK